VLDSVFLGCGSRCAGFVGLERAENARCELSQGLLVREYCLCFRSIQTPYLKKIGSCLSLINWFVHRIIEYMY
jgi:hypothetical protein